MDKKLGEDASMEEKKEGEKEAKVKELAEQRELNWKRLADVAAQNGVEDMVT